MLFQKLDIKRDIDTVRDSITSLIAQSTKHGWNEKREQRFIQLSQKEIELSNKLTA